MTDQNALDAPESESVPAVDAAPATPVVATMPAVSTVPQSGFPVAPGGYAPPNAASYVGQYPQNPQLPFDVPFSEPGMGRKAMIAAIALIVASVATSLLVGLFGTTIYDYHETITAGGHSSMNTGFHANPNQAVAGIQIIVGSIAGILILIIAIIAAAKNRGRRAAVVAIVLAGGAPILSLIVWAIVGGIAAHHVDVG